MIARRVGVLLPVLLVIVIADPSFAQTTAWTRQIGTSGYEEAWASLVDNGIVYVSGWTEGTFAGETSAGQSDGFLRAYDVDGTELWTTQFGTGADDRAWSLATDGTGLYLTGLTSGAFPGQTNAGDADAYVAKFAFDGTLTWVTEFGSRRFDLGSNVVADSSGVYVTGSTSGTLPGQTHAGLSDVFQARLAADGTLDWVVQYGGAGSDFPFVNAIGPDGIYVDGYTFGDLARPVRGELDAFVSLFQPDGTIAWTRQFGTRDNDWGYGLAADATGAYVTGSTNGVFQGQRDRGGDDAYAMLLSATDGSTLWKRQFGTSKDDVSYGAFLSGGTLYAVGSTDGGFGQSASAGGKDAFVQAIDAGTGDRAWTYQFGTTRDDEGFADWVDASALYAVGITNGAFEGETKGGNGDGYVMRIDLP
jgi:hypothetical protein